MVRYDYAGQDVRDGREAGEERGHPHAFGSSPTVSDRSLALESKMDRFF